MTKQEVIFDLSTLLHAFDSLVLVCAQLIQDESPQILDRW